MAVRHALITALSVGAALGSAVMVPKTNPVQNTTMYLYVEENKYPQNYNGDPIGLCNPHDSNGGYAVCSLGNYNISGPNFLFVPDKTNIAKNGANSGILIYEGDYNSNALAGQFVSTSGDGAEFLPQGSNPQNLFVGGDSTGNGPVSFYYNFQTQDFGVITQPARHSALIQQSQFFVCQVVYSYQSIVQLPNLVYTPTGAYPGQGCENVTISASPN